MCNCGFASSAADFAPDELEMGVRELILKDLETFIRRQLPGKYHHHPHSLSRSQRGLTVPMMVNTRHDTDKRCFWCTAARLQLFGSSRNGFGFKQSDLDICMVLEGQESINVRYPSVEPKIDLQLCFSPVVRFISVVLGWN